MSATSTNLLTIVIPALNEEQAIGDTIERCLAARAGIIESGGVDGVEVIVVSDGSTDQTENIASQYEGVQVLIFEKNRGYGAAIKCGFEHGKGSLVGFLDADGTCDPRVFSSLCRAINEDGADLALGSRMGPGSKMPLIRRLGNLAFALMLGVLSKSKVDDSASGMRVIRRDRLVELYPLPDGLDFTPAMSARALLEGKLKVVSIPMPYEERQGESKLSVIRDGIRFFDSIIRTALCHRPSRPLLLTGFFMLFLSVLAGWLPMFMWMREGRFDEWLIYRIVLSAMLGTLAGLHIASAVVAEKIAALAHDRPTSSSGVTGFLMRFFGPRARGAMITGLLAVAVIVVHPGLFEYFSSGQVVMHWSRPVFSAMLVLLAGILGLAGILLTIVDLVAVQRIVPLPPEPPDRIILGHESERSG